MNPQTLTRLWDHFRQGNGIAIRAIEAVPADKIDSNPIPKMRTVKQLAVHMYAMIWRECAEGALRGEIRQIDEKAICDTIRTKDDLLRYCRECFDAATMAADAMTQEKLDAIVKTPWGVNFPGSVVFGTIHDEFLHHRGQLYAFVRALGAEPPVVWDFENNAPEYRPKAATTT